METTITFKDLLKRWKEEAGIEKDVTLVSKKGRCLIICTRRPGWYIGKSGGLCEKYFQMIENGKTDKGERIIRSPFDVGELEKIEFVETFDKI
jgi:ribosomal protein S3